MIDLREVIYYEEIEDIIVEIFNQYQWALSRFGMNFDQEILETIIYCERDLESSLQAFCGWVLTLKEKGETLEQEVLRETFLKAIKEHWQPTFYQQKMLKKYQDILIKPQDFYWQKAQEFLGDQLRNDLIIDITSNGVILYRENVNLNRLSEEDLNKLTEFKNYLTNF